MALAVEAGDALVCDDVRREANGKLLFIGVYSAGIVVAELPAALILHLVVLIRAKVAAEPKVQFRVMLNGQQIRSGRGQMTVRPGNTWVPLSPMVLEKLDAEGTLDFQMKFDDGEWKTACTVPLTRSPTNAGATEPQPPS